MHGATASTYLRGVQQFRTGGERPLDRVTVQFALWEGCLQFEGNRFGRGGRKLVVVTDSVYPYLDLNRGKRKSQSFCSPE